MRNRKSLSAIPDDASKSGKDIRDNFAKLEDTMGAMVLGDFVGRHMDIIIEGASVAVPVAHKLGFVPQDIIETRVYTPGLSTPNSFTWLWNQFDINNIYLTTTGTVAIRFFLGRVL